MTPEKEEAIKILQSQEYRLSRGFYKIINANGKPVGFRMNWAQRKFIKERANLDVILKVRQLGFSTYMQISQLDDCLFIPNCTVGTISHTLPDAQGLLRKAKYAYDNLDPDIINFFGLPKIVKNNETEITFSNGSRFYVGTSFRGGTLQRLHISELGKIAAISPIKAREIKTGALNAVSGDDGTTKITIESTAEGQDGWFYELCMKGLTRLRRKEPEGLGQFRFHFFSWLQEKRYERNGAVPDHINDYCDRLEERIGFKIPMPKRAFYAEVSEKNGDLVKREFPSTPEEAFEAAIEGQIFAHELSAMDNNNPPRIGVVPQVSGVPVVTGWDLGISDNMAIWFAQVVGREVRVIDYYANNGYEFSHYASVLQQKAIENNWVYGRHYFPHDVSVKELGAGDRVLTLKKLGITATRIARVKSEWDGINTARKFFPSVWIDAKACDKSDDDKPWQSGIKSLRAFRKEYDEKRGCYREKSHHDWASDGAKAFICLASGVLGIGHGESPDSANKAVQDARRKKHAY